MLLGLHLTFWMYKSKTIPKGIAPIYLRITSQGQNGTGNWRKYLTQSMEQQKVPNQRELG
jgi:hypothetical protein